MGLKLSYFVQDLVILLLIGLMPSIVWSSEPDCGRLLNPSIVRRMWTENVNYKNMIDHALVSRGFEHYTVDGYLSASGMEYNRDFYEVLNGLTIEQWAEGRRFRGKTSHTMDLFGSAIFSEQPKLFNSLTGVRLVPFDPKHLPASYQNLNRSEVIGDLTLRRTWSLVDENLKSRSIEKLDLIIIRPVGPLEQTSVRMLKSPEEFNTNMGLFYVILNEAWHRLSDQEGLLLIESPKLLTLFEPRMNRWIEKLQSAGISVHLSELGIRIDKTKRSPADLPKLSAAEIRGP